MYLKVIVTVLVAVILGAIGSGLWERLFSPLFDATVNLVIGGLASISTSFKDSIYEEAAQGFNERHSVLVLTLAIAGFAGLLSGAVSMAYFSRKKDAIHQIERVSRVIGPGRGLGHPLLVGGVALSLLVFFAITNITALVSNNITTYSLNSIEILGAKISNETRLNLRSEFFSIKDAEDFYAFHEKLQQLSSETGLELRDFDPL